MENKTHQIEKEIKAVLTVFSSTKNPNEEYRAFRKIKTIARKSGFITKENRQLFWKALLNKSIERNTLDTIKNIKREHDIDRNYAVFSIEKDQGVVDKDTPRCIFHQYKRSDTKSKIKVNPKILQKSIKDFLKNKKIYSYYQGYLDIAVYFRVLFYQKETSKNSDYYLKFLDLFTNLFVLDYISPLEIGKNLYEIVIKVLNSFINIRNHTLYTYLQENDFILYSVISWVLTFLTHNVSNFDIICRIFDYLIVSPPYTIYIISALILIDSFETISEEDLDEDAATKISLAFKSIELNDLDYDNIINRTEYILTHNELDIAKIIYQYKDDLYWTFNNSINGIDIVTRNNSVEYQVMQFKKFLRKNTIGRVKLNHIELSSYIPMMLYIIIVILIFTV